MHFGKYIHTQQLRRLQYPELDALPVFDYIDALGEHPHLKRKLEYARPEIPGEDELWPLVSNRNRFLADQSIRRLCVTVEGGVGKTKLLEELEATVAYDHPDQVVLRCELRELPTQADHFLDSGPRVLVQVAWKELTRLRKEFTVNGLAFPESGSPADPVIIPDEIINMVQRAARTGDLCLIVDAFDQLDKQAASERARALNDFISGKYCPKLRCVIAGRPYAIKRVWEDLNLGSIQKFNSIAQSNDKQYKKPVWDFCKLQKFSSEQVAEYLSAASAEKCRDQIEAMKRLDAQEIHLPRTLNIVRKLTAGQLREMQTAADLYWHAMNQTIIDNFRRARTEYQLQHLRVEHVRPIVAAVAFAMMLWKDEPVVEVPSIAKDKARDFLNFMEKAGFVAILEKERIQFEKELLELAEVDTESLQFHFYSESLTKEAPNEVRDIRMSDATVRDFFAAHWAARYLKPQLEWLNSRKETSGAWGIDLDLRLRECVNSSDFKNFWTLLVGMPNEGAISDDEAATEASWTVSVSPLFEVRELRLTGLMYRCWPDLLWRAGFMKYRDHIDGPNWNETPMATGTLKAQQEVRRLFENGETTHAISPAKRLVVEFLSDYLVQCKAQAEACMSDPNVTPEMKAQFYLDCDFTPIDIKSIALRSKEFEDQRKKRLAFLNEHYPLWLLERSFRVIDGGPLLYGDSPDPANPSFVDTFEINAYLLSEGMYRCFDQRYQRKEFDHLKTHSGATWYQALMFSIWSHGRLPNEREWEAAARGKIGVLDPVEYWDYGFENGIAGLLDYADVDRPFEDGSSEVGHRFPTTVSELFDVHGQLWEWCSNYYDSELEGLFVAYSLRGGSFKDHGFFARCSFRNQNDPRLPFRSGGVRVFRTRNP